MMDEHSACEKTRVAWGSVFLTFIACVALTAISLTGAHGIEREEPILGALLCSVLLSVVTVPLLLTVPGSSPTLIAGGRILLWVQAAAVLTAGVLLMVEIG